ncbi:MAG: hypothetical protein LUG58_04630, partial [Clostridiales bacterium]|nr:hypothetical protein [Clostridiales bacterium]
YSDKSALTSVGVGHLKRLMLARMPDLHHPKMAQTTAGEVQRNRQPQPPMAELHHPKTAQPAAGEVQRDRQPQLPTPELYHPKTAQTAAGEVQRNRQPQPHFDGIPIAQRGMGTLAERAMRTIPGLPTEETAPLRQKQPGDFAENGNEPLVHPAVSAEGSALPTAPPQAGRKAGLPPVAPPWAARSRADEKPGTASARQSAPSAQRVTNWPDATTAPEKPAYQASYGLQGETLTHRTDGEQRGGAAGAPGQGAAYTRQPQPLGGADNRNLRPPFPEQAESGGTGHSGSQALAQTSRTAGSRSQPSAHGAHPAEPAEPREQGGQQTLAAPPTITPSVLREIRTTLTEPGTPSLRGAGMAQTVRDGRETLTWFTAEEGGGLPAAVALEHDSSSRRGTEAVDGEGSRLASQHPGSSGQYHTAASPGGHQWTAATAPGTSMPTASPGVQPQEQGEAASARQMPSAYETGKLGTLRRQPLTVQRTMGTSGFPGNTPAGAAGVPQGAAPAAGQLAGHPDFPSTEFLSHRGGRNLADSVPPGGRNGERVPFAPANGRRETPLSQRTPNTQALPKQPVGEGGWPEQVELSYLPQQPGAEQPQSVPPPAQPAMDSEYVRSLPGWAQDFLKEGRPGAETSGSGTQMGVARNIAALPTGTAQQEQVTWTAPQANQANRRPAEITYKQKEEPQDKTAQTGRMSDSELRRTADKVYQMIEERIRRERRRLGL